MRPGPDDDGAIARVDRHWSLCTATTGTVDIVNRAGRRMGSGVAPHHEALPS